MLKGILYEVEIQEPTNSGEYSTRKIFDNEQEARDYINSVLANYDKDEIEDHPEVTNEWEASGPNWGILECYVTDWEIITLSKIDNDYKEDK